MADTTVIKPDLNFVRGIIAEGGESLKKCYQCATCSVVCNVTPDNKPFPRKEMIWAQWGLKEKFIGNPDVWLCHQCNDCTAYCPRGAKPGEVLGAIRKQTIKHYSVPSFLAKIVSNKNLVWLIFLFPVILLWAVLSADGTFIPKEEDIKFSYFAPVLTIQLVFIPALVFGSVIGITGVVRFWKDMKLIGGVTSGDLSAKQAGLKGSIIETVKEILGHGKFRNCTENRDRFLSHFLVFYSFVALAIATGFGVLYIDILHKPSPFSFGYGTPVKIFGVIGAVGLLIGIVLMVSNRFKHAPKVGIGGYFDWLLIMIIGVIMATGILSWLTRVADIATLAYLIYFVHLVFVFSLFIYLPYSKLAHLFYRTTAIVFAKYTGREKTNP